MDALEDYDDDNDGFEDYEDYCSRILAIPHLNSRKDALMLMEMAAQTS